MEEDLSLQSGWPDHPMWPQLINKDSGFTRLEKKGLGGRTPEEKWVGLEVINVLPAFFSWLEQIMWLCLTLRVQRNAMLRVPQSRSFQILLNMSLFTTSCRSLGVVGRGNRFQVTQLHGAVLTSREQAGRASES